MTENIEYGIYFQNSKLSLDKLYSDSIVYTNRVIVENPCVFLKRPIFKKTNLGLTKKYVESKILYDVTENLYRNSSFNKKYYNDFENVILDSDVKPTREEFIPESNNISNHQSGKSNNRFHQVENFDDTDKNASNYSNYRSNKHQEFGYCIRTGQQIPFDVKRPYSLDAYRSWAMFENWNYKERYCHKTGRESNGRTSMSNPVL